MMELNSRRKFLSDSAVLAGGIIGASTIGTRLLYPENAEAGEMKYEEFSFKNNSDTGKKILVTYASDHGSTSEVAAAIGKTLFESGNSVDVRAISNATGLHGYDAVIVGSPIQYDKWMPEAANFLKTNKEVLSKIPVAYFFTCLVLSRKTKKSLIKANEYAEELYSIVPEIEPVSIGQFGGALDYSKMKFFKKIMLASVLFQKQVKEGDYRNWNTIKAWAQGLCLDQYQAM